MSSETRYNRRGVSASKEDVHNAIKHIDKGLFPKAFCKIVPDYLSGDLLIIATLCMPTEPVPNHHWLTFIGKKRVTYRFGKALRRMQLS